MTRGQFQAIAAISMRVGFLGLHPVVHVRQLRAGKLAMRGIVDVDRIAEIVAGSIVDEMQSLWALDADLLAAEQQVGRLRQQVHDLAPGEDARFLAGMLEALDRLDATLVQTPARSLAGAAAKLRRLTRFLGVGEGLAGLMLRDAIVVVERELVL
jgi:hypothetical protein